MEILEDGCQQAIRVHARGFSGRQRYGSRDVLEDSNEMQTNVYNTSGEYFNGIST